MAHNEDDFEHAMKDIMQPAPHECLTSMRNHLEFIKTRHPHTETKIKHCLKGLEGTPTMLRVLVAAYVLNGGVPLKYSLSKESIEMRQNIDSDVDDLLKEMDALNSDKNTIS